MSCMHVAAMTMAVLILGCTARTGRFDEAERAPGREQAPRTAAPQTATPAGPAPWQPVPSPSPAAVIRFLRVEGVFAEQFRGGMRVTLRLTNLADKAGAVSVSSPSQSGRNYLIDDRGNRYRVIDGSDMVTSHRGVTLAPSVPIREWIVFESPDGETSQVAVVLSLYSPALGIDDAIAVQGIPVRR